MVSKGVQNVLDFLQNDFPDMDIIGISGNFHALSHFNQWMGFPGSFFRKSAWCHEHCLILYVISHIHTLSLWLLSIIYTCFFHVSGPITLSYFFPYHHLWLCCVCVLSDLNSRLMPFIGVIVEVYFCIWNCQVEIFSELNLFVLSAFWEKGYVVICTRFNLVC